MMFYRCAVVLSLLCCSGCGLLQDSPPAGSITSTDPSARNSQRSLEHGLAPVKDALTEPQKVRTTTVKTINGVNVFYDANEVVGFSLANTGSPHTNPTGNRNKANTPRREYIFHFGQRARQDIYLEIYEFAIPDGRDSHTAMYSSVYFFPRKVIPSFQFDGGNHLKVTLPTGEPVLVDGHTKEIIDGVVRETRPIDTSRNRQARRFADLAYTGKGVTVRIDQRGEVPESEYLWGRRVAKYAIVKSGNKECKVRANKLWYQGKGRGYNYFLFPTDEEFRQKILVNECGWRDFQFADTPSTAGSPVNS